MLTKRDKLSSKVYNVILLYIMYTVAHAEDKITYDLKNIPHFVIN